MNTGIGDAVNLASKLAAVLNGRAGDNLLDTYELAASTSRGNWSLPPIAFSPW